MVLTIEDLRHVKKECDNLSAVIKEIVASYQIDNSQRKLFVSRRDYEESLKIKNQVPQDFYYFRCFDVFLQIVFNKRTKKYCIYLDGFYSELLNKYKRKEDAKSFEVSDNFDFVFELFNEIIQDIYSHKILQNGLF